MKKEAITVGAWYEMADDSVKQVTKLMPDVPRPGAVRVIAKEIDSGDNRFWIYGLTEFARKADFQRRDAPLGHCRTCSYFHGDPKGRGACHYGAVGGVSANYDCRNYAPNQATRMAAVKGGE